MHDNLKTRGEHKDAMAWAINPFGFMSILFVWRDDCGMLTSKTLIKSKRKLRQFSGNIASERDDLVGIA